MRSKLDRFMTHVEPDGISGCWHWSAATDQAGYGIIGWRGRMDRAHRVSWELHSGQAPGPAKVLHRCDVRGCVNPSHLFLGTQLDNIADMVRKGRQRTNPQFGSNNPQSKLTEAQVADIRAGVATGIPQRRFSEQLGVSPMTISRAVRGETWSRS